MSLGRTLGMNRAEADELRRLLDKVMDGLATREL